MAVVMERIPQVYRHVLWKCFFRLGDRSEEPRRPPHADQQATRASLPGFCVSDFTDFIDKANPV